MRKRLLPHNCHTVLERSPVCLEATIGQHLNRPRFGCTKNKEISDIGAACTWRWGQLHVRIENRNDGWLPCLAHHDSDRVAARTRRRTQHLRETRSTILQRRGSRPTLLPDAPAAAETVRGSVQQLHREPAIGASKAGGSAKCRILALVSAFCGHGARPDVAGRDH